jgi:hypothetical protein
MATYGLEDVDEQAAMMTDVSPVSMRDVTLRFDDAISIYTQSCPSDFDFLI